MQIEFLKPYTKNAKKHDKKQIQKVADSIKNFGFVQPIVIDKNNEVVIGHCRLEAAKILNLKEVPTISVENLTDEQVKAFAKLGDIWQLGRHRLMCGDSTKKEDVEKLMNGQKSDMVFTDPPYGVDYTSRVDKDRRKPWGGIKNDDLKGTALQQMLLSAFDCISETISFYVCCNWQSVKDFFEALDIPNSLIVWDKESIGLGSNYRSQHEFILFYGKLNHRNETNVWRMKRDASASYKHPTQKPVELIVRAITNSSEKENIVLDLFLGSGSTLIACEKTNRICYGMELDEKYCDVIIKRYEDFSGNKAIKL